MATLATNRLPAPSESAGHPWRWLAAMVMTVGSLMDMIDVTIVNVALPTMNRELHSWSG